MRRRALLILGTITTVLLVLAFTSPVPAAAQADSDPAGTTVERGDRGETVAFWQDRLNVWFGLTGSDTRLAVDGIFGPNTEAGTLEFQQATDGRRAISTRFSRPVRISSTAANCPARLIDRRTSAACEATDGWCCGHETTVKG